MQSIWTIVVLALGLLGGSSAQTIQTVAGLAPQADETYPAMEISLNPTAVAADAEGNVYVASGAIYQVSPDGNLQLFAGTGVPGFAGKWPTWMAKLFSPDGLAFGPDGDLYIADSVGAAVWRLTPGTGQASLVAGTPGVHGYSGDGGPALQAKLNMPESVAIDKAGDVYIADAANCAVREVIASSGTIRTFGGGSCQPPRQFWTPNRLRLDAQGDLYVSDNSFGTIWQFAPDGQASLVSGQSDSSTCWPQGDFSQPCPAGEANLSPQAMALDPAGDLFEASGNSVFEIPAGSNLIHLVYRGPGGEQSAFILGMCFTSAQTLILAETGVVVRLDLSSGEITAVAGAAVPYAAGPALDSQIHASPLGLALDPDGDLFVNDSMWIYKIRPAGSESVIAGEAANPLPASRHGLRGIAADGVGDLYLGDSDGYVWQVNRDTGRSSVYAGNGNDPYVTPSILGGVAGITADGTGDVFTVSYAISEITPGGASVLTLANTFPTDSRCLARDAQNNFYLCGINQVERVDGQTGAVTAYAGTGVSGDSGDDGPATAAEIDYPQALGVDAQGNLFIGGDDGLREVLAATGQIKTVAGRGENFDPGFSGAATEAGFGAVTSLVVSPAGNVFFGTADREIREVKTAAALRLSAHTLTFAAESVGTPSAAQQLTFTNSGGIPLHVASIAVSGPAASDFSQAGTCATLAPSESCPLTVIFQPDSPGIRQATLQIVTDAPDGSATIALSGTGAAVDVQLSPLSLDFKNQPVATTSAGQTVTLSNLGVADAAITSVSASPDYAESSQCGARLAPGASCAITVSFNPGDTGPLPGTLTVDLASGTQTIALSGSGFALSLQSATPAGGSQTVIAGQAATYTLELSSQGMAGGALTATCTVAPANSTLGCHVSGAGGQQVSFSGSTPLLVEATTTANTSLPPAPASPRWPGWLGGCLLLTAWGWLSLRNRRPWAAAIALSMAVALAGCGGSTTAPPPPPESSHAAGTPPGTYTLTVTTSLAGATNSLPLTLIVH